MSGWFAPLMLAIAASANAGPELEHDCSSELSPLVVVVPRFPATSHNEYAGAAEMAFVVGQDGGVSQPVIVSLTLRPVGHAGRAPRGYREALLVAVVQWRFAPQPRACRKQVTIEIEQAG